MSEPAAPSGAGGVWRAAAWALLAAALATIYLASDRPMPSGAPLPVSDKVLHFGAYALLAALWLAAFRTTWPARGWTGQAWIAAACAAAYGATDEWHQSFVPGRVMDVWDWVADAAGAAAVALVVTVVATRRRRPA